MTIQEATELLTKITVLGELADRMKDFGKGDSKEFDDAAELYEQSWRETHAFVNALIATVLEQRPRA